MSAADKAAIIALSLFLLGLLVHGAKCLIAWLWKIPARKREKVKLHVLQILMQQNAWVGV